jgi:hypothetical protein
MVQRGGEGVHINRGRVGEERGGKEIDGWMSPYTKKIIST